MVSLIRKQQRPICTVNPTLWAQGTDSPTQVQQNRPVFCKFGTFTIDNDRWMIREFQWLLNGEVLADETDPFYDVAGTIGDTVACRVTAVNDVGQSTVVTTASATIIADARTTRTAASLGVKNFATTGTISAGSTSLVCADVSGFAVSDYILIECGGEPGLGLRGTMGVGGAWPPLSYANAAAMNADTTKAVGTWAWLLDTGKTYRWSGSAWSGTYDSRYYITQSIPRGLKARISAIDVGTKTLTLNVASVAAATNANIYSDMTDALHPVTLSGNTTYNNNVITFPAGTFYWSDMIGVPYAGVLSFARTGLTFQGAGIGQTYFKAPRGFGPQIAFSAGQDCHVRDIEFTGNQAVDSYCFRQMHSTTSIPDVLVNAIYMNVCHFTTIKDVKIVNFPRAWAPSYGTYHWAVDCIVTNIGQDMYFQWQYNLADMEFGGCYRCQANNGTITPSFEAFRSANVYFVDCVATNAISSTNTCGDIVWDNYQVTNADNKGTAPGGTTTVISENGHPLIDVNGNIGSQSGGAGTGLQARPVWIRNPTLIQTGWPYGSGSGIPLKGVSCSATYLRTGGAPGLLVSGGYPSNPSQGGLIEGPATGLRLIGVISVVEAVMRGLRVKGMASETPNNNNSNLTCSNNAGTVRLCVADTINAATETANQTNAEYEA